MVASWSASDSTTAPHCAENYSCADDAAATQMVSVLNAVPTSMVNVLQAKADQEGDN